MTRPRVLVLDTTGGRVAAAVWAPDRLLAALSELWEKGRADRTAPLAAEAVAAAGIVFADIDLIAVIEGPASFTAARSGVAAARGFALALGRPAVGLDARDLRRSPDEPEDAPLDLASAARRALGAPRDRRPRPIYARAPDAAPSRHAAPRRLEHPRRSTSDEAASSGDQPAPEHRFRSENAHGDE